jgi:hypothetical protein
MKRSHCRLRETSSSTTAALTASINLRRVKGSSTPWIRLSRKSCRKENESNIGSIWRQDKSLLRSNTNVYHSTQTLSFLITNKIKKNWSDAAHKSKTHYRRSFKTSTQSMRSPLTQSSYDYSCIRGGCVCDIWAWFVSRRDCSTSSRHV